MEQFCIASISEKATELTNKIENYQTILNEADATREKLFKVKSVYNDLYRQFCRDLPIEALKLSEKIKTDQANKNELANVFCRQKTFPNGIDYANGKPSSYRYSNAFTAYGKEREHGFFEGDEVYYINCNDSAAIINYEQQNYTLKHRILIKVNDKTHELTPDIFAIAFTFFYYKYDANIISAVEETKNFFEEYREIGTRQPQEDLSKILFKNYILPS